MNEVTQCAGLVSINARSHQLCWVTGSGCITYHAYISLLSEFSTCTCYYALNDTGSVFPVVLIAPNPANIYKCVFTEDYNHV